MISINNFDIFENQNGSSESADGDAAKFDDFSAILQSLTNGFENAEAIHPTHKICAEPSPANVQPKSDASNIAQPKSDAPNIAAPNITAPNVAAPNIAASKIAAPKISAPKICAEFFGETESKSDAPEISETNSLLIFSGDARNEPKKADTKSDDTKLFDETGETSGEISNTSELHQPPPPVAGLNVSPKNEPETFTEPEIQPQSPPPDFIAATVSERISNDEKTSENKFERKNNFEDNPGENSEKGFSRRAIFPKIFDNEIAPVNRVPEIFRREFTSENPSPEISENGLSTPENQKSEPVEKNIPAENRTARAIDETFSPEEKQIPKIFDGSDFKEKSAPKFEFYAVSDAEIESPPAAKQVIETGDLEIADGENEITILQTKPETRPRLHNPTELFFAAKSENTRKFVLPHEIRISPAEHSENRKDAKTFLSDLTREIPVARQSEKRAAITETTETTETTFAVARRISNEPVETEVLTEAKKIELFPASEPEVQMKKVEIAAENETPRGERFQAKETQIKTAESVSPEVEAVKPELTEANFKIAAPEVETREKTELKTPEMKSTVETFELSATVEPDKIRLPNVKARHERDSDPTAVIEPGKIQLPNTKESKLPQTDASRFSADGIKILEQVRTHLRNEFFILNEKLEKPNLLKFRLRPAELGAVEVRLEKSESGNLIAHFQTETEAARQSLVGHSEQIREALQNSGWQVEKLDFSCDSFSSAAGNSRRENQSRYDETVERKFSDSDNFDAVSEKKDDSAPNRLVSLRA